MWPWFETGATLVCVDVGAPKEKTGADVGASKEKTGVETVCATIGKEGRLDVVKLVRVPIFEPKEKVELVPVTESLGAPQAGHAACATVGTPHVVQTHDKDDNTSAGGGRTSECRLQTAARFADKVVPTPSPLGIVEA